MKRMSWIDGWHDISDNFSIYCENGEIVRGVEDGRPVFPYKRSSDGGYDRVYHVKACKADFLKVRFF